MTVHHVSFYENNARVSVGGIIRQGKQINGQEGKKWKPSWGKCSKLGFERNAAYRFLCVKKYQAGSILGMKAWPWCHIGNGQGMF